MKAPATILFVHDGEDWIRGSERCLLDLIAHLDRRRFRPVVWCTSDVFGAAVAELGVDVHRGRGWEPAAAARWPDRALRREACTLIERYAVRLIHANAVGPVKWLIPAARAARIPLVAHMHNPSDHVERRLAGLHQASLVVAVSAVTAQGFLDDGMPASAVRVIHNGVDVDRIARGDARAMRAGLGIRRDAIVLAHAGSLIPRKGVDVLLRAHAALRQRGREVHLLVIGAGHERPSLERLAGELGLCGTVHFLGERRAVGAVLRDAADLFVSAARSEAFPLALLEAALMGKPVVASAIAAHHEAVVDGETGLLVPGDDPTALAAGVDALLADPARRQQYGAAARRRAEREFAVGRYVARFEGAYEMLLARSSREYGWLGAWRWPRAYWWWLGDLMGQRLPTRRRVPSPSAPSVVVAAQRPLSGAVQER